ncbi:hypothetical protein ACNKHK_18910 [Shigella flexneri]
MIASERRFLAFEPGVNGTVFPGYARDQYFVDPCKLLLTTPASMRKPANTPSLHPVTILVHYLRERHRAGEVTLTRFCSRTLV